MAIVDMVMPKMGESIMEATVLKWHKKVGDTIKMDETLLEIATDKVDSEVPATAGGYITELLFKENDVVPVGTVIARISTEATVEASAPVAVPEPPIVTVNAAPMATVAIEASMPVVSNGAPRFYSPLVLNIAAKEGISMTELERIPGTGSEGRVSKKDILSYIDNRGKVVSAPTTVVEAPVVVPSRPKISSSATRPP
ncbi:MAG: hypothetical protein EBX41_06375 [Chitinophagia bacterium]|nr:hypothetical protein [Chitinophagia bacterium]